MGLGFHVSQNNAKFNDGLAINWLGRIEILEIQLSSVDAMPHVISSPNPKHA